MKIKFLFLLLLFAGSLQYVQSKNTWQHINSMSDTYLYRVYAISPDTVFVAGEGLIAKSTDYGNTWQRTTIPDNVIIKDIIFCNKETGFAVGEKGSIYKTTDGGITWNVKTSNTTNDLNAVAYVTQDSMWAVGNSGTVLSSLDGGETWQQKDFSATENLNDVKFYGYEGYIVGNDGLFYKTTNSGDNWNSESVNINRNTLLGIQKTLNNNLYILAGDESPYTLYVKNDSGNYTFLAQANGFGMTNNGIGYSFFAGILTNGGENIIELSKIENNEVIDVNTIFKSWSSDHVDYHCSVSITADTMIYVVTGNVLLKSSPNMTSDVKLPFWNNKNLTIKDNLDGSLTLKANYPVISYQLINTFGEILFSENINSAIVETKIGIQSIPEGVNILHVVFADKTSTTLKWIKH